MIYKLSFKLIILTYTQFSGSKNRQLLLLIHNNKLLIPNQMNSDTLSSSIKKIRENFAKSIRKSQIQKIHREKREKHIKTFNPLYYLDKTKNQLINGNLQIQKIIDIVEFIAQNIKTFQFALTVQKEQLIEIIILKTIQATQPWMSKDIVNKNHQFRIDSQFYNQNQYFDCQQNSTAVSENHQDQYFYEELEINQRTFQSCLTFQQNHSNQMPDQRTQKFIDKSYLLLGDLLNLLALIFQMVFLQINNYSHQKNWIFKMNENYFTDKNFAFKNLFINSPQILQGLLLDLLGFQNTFTFKDERQLQIYNMKQRYPLIFKIVSLLSKYAQTTYFNEDQWFHIIKIYFKYFLEVQTQVKNQFQNIDEIKNLLILLSKSSLSKEILSNTKFTNQINKFIFPWMKVFNQTLSQENNKKDFERKTLSEDFINEFQFVLNIFEDLKFLEKELNEQIKLILGELLNISKNLEVAQGNFSISYFHTSSKQMPKEEYEIQKKCRCFAEKLIEILYMQMELTEDDLNMITQVQPIMKAKIQKIIDADCY